MFFALTTAVALEALWQIYCYGWSNNVTAVLDENGARGRWFEQFGREIGECLEALQ